MRYTLRAVKYFVKLLILLAVIFCLMSLSGTTVFSAENFMAEFFSTTRGRIFSAAVVIWCALYPKVEYISRSSPTWKCNATVRKSSAHSKPPE